MALPTKLGRSLGAFQFGPPVQIAYVVADVDSAAARWSQTVGAGPFFVRRHIQVSEVMYRGEPSTFDHTSAYGQWGPLMVELVQDHNSGMSVLNEGLPNFPSSVHHVACMVDDFSATLAAARSSGVGVAMTARARTTPFAFLDTVASLGHFIEIYPRSDSLVRFYALVADAAADWDGRDVLRPLD
jgi:hypothetical protein